MYFLFWVDLLSKILKNHNSRVVFAYVFAKQIIPEMPKKANSRKYSISIGGKMKAFRHLAPQAKFF